MRSFPANISLVCSLDWRGVESSVGRVVNNFNIRVCEWVPGSSVGTPMSSSKAVEARGGHDAARSRLAHRSLRSPHPNVSPCACFGNINHPLQENHGADVHSISCYTDHTVFLKIYACIRKHLYRHPYICI